MLMFSHVMLGVNDLEVSKKFYDAILGTLGLTDRNFNHMSCSIATLISPRPASKSSPVFSNALPGSFTTKMRCRQSDLRCAGYATPKATPQRV